MDSHADTVAFGRIVPFYTLQVENAMCHHTLTHTNRSRAYLLQGQVQHGRPKKRDQRIS
jgi:hypothetical protein